ncbi:MAG: metallophosphoesterase [Eubacteriales bacterium]
MVIFIGIILIVMIYFIIIMIRDGNRFVVKEYVIESKKIEKDYQFILLSDLHNKSYGKDNCKLLQVIGEIHPESIMIAGDILTGKPNASFHVAADLISRLAEKYPLYYGLGNHEQRLKLYPETYGTMWEDYWKELDSYGVKPLENKSILINNTNLYVSGLAIEKKYYQRFEKSTMETVYLEKELGKPKKEYFHILLAHNPEYFEEYEKWGADLVLSGHVHGGIMKFPFLGGAVSPSIKLFPKYDGGLFAINETKMILSRGLGMHTLPIRIWNPGELVVVRVKHKEEK